MGPPCMGQPSAFPKVGGKRGRALLLAWVGFVGLAGRKDDLTPGHQFP